jgi:hypothetical protein
MTSDRSARQNVQANKIWRELRRISDQGTDKLVWPLEWARKALHDRRFPGNLSVRDGAVPLGSQVALFLLHQPDGIAASSLLTCTFLRDRGYAVVVVSNGPLSADDRARLLPVTSRVIERPNYGYDFGGYRDGLRYLRHLALRPDVLLMLNDSIWFPVAGGTLLDRMERDPAAFQSPVFEKKAGRRAHNTHFQSYLFLMRRSLLEHPAFDAYWEGYHISNNKRVVLQRGEKGFSQAMFRAGFGGDAPSTRRVLFDRLKTQETAFLRKTLSYAAYEDPALVDDARRLLKDVRDTPDWRAAALGHFDGAVEANQPMGSYCYACATLLGFDFLKKSSYPVVHDGMRHQYLRAVEAGDLPSPAPEVLAEIKASRRDGRLTTDPAFGPDR